MSCGEVLIPHRETHALKPALSIETKALETHYNYDIITSFLRGGYNSSPFREEI